MPDKPERKRARVSNPQTEHDDPTDDERHPHDDPPRPGQVERKRELERNRRNLVNVRFAELEAELRRTAPRIELDSAIPDNLPARTPKGKRIDKEAVLKDAAQRLITQRKDLAAATDRLSAMISEIQNLRSEKVELRSEKAYLRSELETVRRDVHRLRSDNINLWQALRKASSFKNAFAPDVAKLPAELFLRPKTTDPPPQTTDELQTHPLLADPPKPHIPPPTSLPATSGCPPVSQSPQHHTLQHMLLMQQQQEEEQRRQLQSMSNPVDNTNSHTPPNVTLPTDSFLMLQSAAELGELFASYVPRELSPDELPAQPLPRENPSSIPSIPSPSSEPTANSLFPTMTSQCQNIQQACMPNQTIFSAEGHTLGKDLDPLSHDTSVRNLQDPSHSNPAKTEASSEGPVSDIAYCV